MANPIIKIKRGSGEPPVWPEANGLTAGEFAFDRTTGMLYLGVTGQYLLTSDSEGYQGLCALNGPFVIPVGAQISDDETFGVFEGDAFDNTLGFSSNTIPTTRAVRQFVLEQKAAAALGVTLQAGTGIEFNYPTADVLRIDNAGALEAFSKTQLQAQGGVVTGTTSTTPIGATAGVLKYIARSGIAIDNSIINGIASLAFTNIGVTGINGFTGNITNIGPINSLSGYTSSANYIARNSILLVGSNAINVTPTAEAALIPGITAAIFTASHQTILGSAETGNELSYGGYRNGTFYVPSITMDNLGHVKNISQTALFGDGLIPAGLTEAVQDIVGDSSFLKSGSGISVNYNDSQNTLTISNTGVTGIKVGSTVVDNLVTLQADGGSGITIVANAGNDTITIGQNIPYYKTVNLSGNNTATVSIAADEKDDALSIVAGTGIKFNTGDIASDQFTIINDGVSSINGVTGAVTIVRGDNIDISTVGKTITISSSAGGGGGSIGSINAQYEIGGAISATGVTGFVAISGITYGQGEARAFDYGKNIVTYRSVETIDGDVFVDLSSHLKLQRDDTSDGASITVPNQYDFRQGPSILRLGSINGAYSDNGIYTPFIYAGMTGAQILTVENGQEVVDNDQTPGKELILKSTGGLLDTGLGGVSSTAFDAVFVLSGYPTNNNFVNYIVKSGWNVGLCPGGNCVGFPPNIPGCQSSGDFDGSTDINRGSATIIANTIIDGALAVQNDIFLKGNIYNENGCKLDIGAASQASDYFDACGTLRNPGGIYLNGSICDADSDRAIFNVSEFFIKDRLVTIGGASGNNAPTNNGQFGTTMDVGFLMPSYLNNQPRTAFIGIDTSAGTEGTFKFIPTASLTEDGTGRFVGGNVGPAEFASINGISFDNAIAISVGVKNSSGGAVTPSSNRTRISSKTVSENTLTVKGNGHINFPSSTSLGNAANITLDTAAVLGIAQNGSIISGIGGPVNFTNSLQGITFSASSNQMTIVKRTNSFTGTYLFPTVTNDTSIIVDTATTQTLTAKTLSTDCVIDCGGY